LAKRNPEARLRLFAATVENMITERAGVIEGTLQADMTIAVDADGTRFSFEFGNDEHFRSLLLDLRKFFAPREDVYFEGICQILDAALQDAELREAAGHNLSWWRAAQEGKFQLMADGKRYTAKAAFDLIVNGHLFHLDEAKAAEYDAFPDYIQKSLDINMRQLCMTAVNILVPHRNLVEAAFERSALRF